MPTEPSAVVRPVVPQDAAAAAARAALALPSVLVALPWWDSPVIALGFVLVSLVYLGVGLRSRPFKSARRWVDDLAEVPRADDVVAPTATAVGVGLALGGSGGLVLLLLVTVVLLDPIDSQSILLVPSGVVLGRALDRLLITRAVRRWEREQGVVLCRRRAPNQSGVELFHEADVERMVAVPVAR